MQAEAPAGVPPELSRTAEEMRDLIDQLLALQNSLSDTTLELEEADDFKLIHRLPATPEAALTAVDNHMMPEQQGMTFISGLTKAAQQGPRSNVPKAHVGSASEGYKDDLDTEALLTTLQKATGPAPAEVAGEPVQHVQQKSGPAVPETASPVLQVAAQNSSAQEWKQAGANVQSLHSGDSAGGPQKVSVQSPFNTLQAPAEAAFQIDSTRDLAALDSWVEAPCKKEQLSQMHQPDGESSDPTPTAMTAGERTAGQLAGMDDFAVLPLEDQQGRELDSHNDSASRALPRPISKEERDRSADSSDLPGAFGHRQRVDPGRLEPDERGTVLTLKSQLSDMEAFVSELQSSLAKSDSNVEDLAEDVARKSQEIVDLRNKVAASTVKEAKAAMEMDALQFELEASQETVASMQADLEAERQLAYNNSAAHSLALELAEQHLYGTVSHLLIAI